MNGLSGSFLALLVGTLLVASPAVAVPRTGGSQGRQYFVVAEDLSSWHAGAYIRSQRRDFNVNGLVTEFEINRGIAYVGYDLLPQVTVYALTGISGSKPKHFGNNESAVEAGVGAWFNLLDHDTFDFLLTVKRFRLNALLQYSMFSNDEFTMGEMAGNVTFGLTNLVEGSKFMWPDALTLYAGPCFNWVHSDDLDQSGGDVFGMTVGLDMHVNKRTTLSVGGEFYRDGRALMGSVGLRF